MDSVSRETMHLLESYVALVRKWNPKVNLVSRTSLEEIWQRHISDSLQVAEMDAASGYWVDLGSGAGLPGLVVAICRAGKGLDSNITLVESDQRKSAFLRTAARELKVNATILAQRIEACAPQNADTVSARALAPLTILLAHADQHLAPEGRAIFPKGASWKEEVEIARDHWSFEHEVVQSKTCTEAAILVIKNIKKR